MLWEELVLIFGNHFWLIAALACYIGGIESIFLVGIFAGQGLAPFWEGLLFAYIGYFLFELTFFLIGRSRIAVWAKTKPKLKRTYKHSIYLVKKITGDNILFALVLSKILYGAGTMILVYLSRRKLTLKQFLVYNSAVLLVSTTAICYIGWLAGRGLSKTIDMFDNARLLILFIVVFIVLFHSARGYIDKFIEKINWKKKKKGKHKIRSDNRNKNKIRNEVKSFQKV